jgi:hypothetical protein
VLDIGTRLSVQTGSIIQAWMNAPDEILAVNNEVSDLNLIFDELKNVCQIEGAKSVEKDGRLVLALKQQIAAADKHLNEMKFLLDRLASMKKYKRRLKWLRQTSDVKKIHQNLRAVRLNTRELMVANSL